MFADVLVSQSSFNVMILWIATNSCLILFIGLYKIYTTWDNNKRLDKMEAIMYMFVKSYESHLDNKKKTVEAVEVLTQKAEEIKQVAEVVSHNPIASEWTGQERRIKQEPPPTNGLNPV